MKHHTLVFSLIIATGLLLNACTDPSAPAGGANNSAASNSSQAEVPPIGPCESPLDVLSPVYAGTKIIAYYHGTERCDVQVFADSNLVGTGTVGALGMGEILLTQPLKAGQLISASQSNPAYATRL